MLRTLSATTVCCGANAAQRTVTVTKKPLKTLGKQIISAKSNVLQIRGRCSARPARATAEATSYRRQVAYPASPHLDA